MANQLERLLVILDLESSRFRKGMVGARGSVNAFDTAVRDVRRSLMSLMSVYAGVKLGGMFLQAAKETEKFRMQLQTVLKSAEAGNAAFQWARDFARQTPHDTANVVQAFNIMTATGIKGVQGFMTAIGDAAYVMNKDIVDVATAVVSLEKRVWRRMGVTINRVGKEWSVSMEGIKIVTEHNLDAVRAALEKVLKYSFGGGMELAKTQWAGTMAIMRSLWWEFRSDVMGSGQSGSPFSYMIVEANKLKDAWEAWTKTDSYKKFIREWQRTIQGAIYMVIDALTVLGRNIGLITALLKAFAEAWFVLKVIHVITRYVKAYDKAMTKASKVMGDASKKTAALTSAHRLLYGSLVAIVTYGFLLWMDHMRRKEEELYDQIVTHQKEIVVSNQGRGRGGNATYTTVAADGIPEGETVDERAARLLKAQQEAEAAEAAEQALEEAKLAALAERQAAYEALRKTVESLSKSIRSDWISSTKTAQEQNDIWLKDQLAALDAVKSANANYETDKTRLMETHAARDKEILAQQTEDVKAGIFAQIALMQNKIKYGFASASQFIPVLEELLSTLPELSEEWMAVTDAIAGMTEQMDKAEEATKSLGDTMKDALSEKLKQIPETLSGAFASAIVYGDNLSESLINLAKDIMYTVVRAWLLKSIFGGLSGGGLLGGVTGGLSGFTGLASGGPVSAGQSYIVGEEGPELFTPSSSGSIIPNGTEISASGTGDVTVNVFNETGTKMNAKSESRFDGVRTVIDLWLQGYTDNVSGIQRLVGGQ